MLTLLLAAVLLAEPAPAPVPGVGAANSWHGEKCLPASARTELYLVDTDLSHVAQIFAKALCKPIVFSAEVNDLKFSIYLPLEAAAGPAQLAKIFAAALRTVGVDMVERDGIVALSKKDKNSKP